MESTSDNLQEGRDGELNSQGEPPISDWNSVCVCVCLSLVSLPYMPMELLRMTNLPQVYETCLFVHASAHVLFLGCILLWAFNEYLAQFPLWLVAAYYTSNSPFDGYINLLG
jgi:hypothetical protein